MPETCENPFLWMNNRETLEIPGDIIRRVNYKLRENNLDIHSPYPQLMLYIVLAFEYALEENCQGALNALEDAEESFRTMIVIFRNNHNDRLCPAFQHVLMSTKVHLLDQKGNVDAAIQTALQIPSIDKMDDANKAAVQYGFRALFFRKYGAPNFKLVIDLFSKAIEMNPYESLWHFMKERSSLELERATKNFVDVPIRESISRMEEILRSGMGEENKYYMAYTAELYREYAESHQISKIVDTVEVEKLSKKSATLYRKCIELTRDHRGTLLRCALGFVSLPHPFRDLKLAKELLDRALYVCPNHGFGNYVMAKYYDKLKKPERSIEHLEICEDQNMFIGIKELIRLKLKLDPKYDAFQKLQSLFKDFNGERHEIVQILYELAAYCLFISGDLRTACDYANRIMDFGDLGDSYLQCSPCRNLFHDVPESLDEALTDEIAQQQEEYIICGPYYDEILQRLSSRRKDKGAEPDSDDEISTPTTKTSLSFWLKSRLKFWK